MEHQGGFGGNPSGHFTPSFPTPANIGAQASHQAPFQANGSEPFISGAGMPWPGHPNANALAPPAAAVAPQTFQPESHPYWAMPPAGALNASPFQHFSGAAARPVRGEELAARVAAININILASQPFHPNNYTHGGWPQQAPPAGANSYGGATGWAPPMPHPAGWQTSWAPPAQQPGGEAMSWAPPAQQPGGQMSWTPPVQQQPGGQAMSWAAPAQQPGGEAMSWAPPEQRRRVPAAPPASGSAQAQPPVMMTSKSLEEFLMEAGIIDERAVDNMIIENLIKDLMGDGTAESGPVQPGGPVVSLGGYGQPPPSAAGSSSSVWAGQRSDQLLAEAKMRIWSDPKSSRS
ncbi:trithorax group protein osa-like [Setaria italica]|uniref:trithorax group protein osa-like n=1 Tax=Setaria italica TaxID=4555 RepID=UPI000645C1ED|nr:trithorax group protein osa-like [Setaria italica]